MHQVAANQAPGRPGGRGERGGAVPGRPGVGSLGQRVEEGGRRKQGRRPVLVRGGGRAAGDGARGGGPTSTFAAHVCARWAGLAREERASTGRRRRAERRQGMGRAQRRGRALGPPFFAEHNLHSLSFPFPGSSTTHHRVASPVCKGGHAHFPAPSTTRPACQTRLLLSPPFVSTATTTPWRA